MGRFYSKKSVTIMSEKLYNIISKVFSVPISEINDESGPETIECGIRF